MTTSRASPASPPTLPLPSTRLQRPSRPQIRCSRHKTALLGVGAIVWVILMASTSYRYTINVGQPSNNDIRDETNRRVVLDAFKSAVSDTQMDSRDRSALQRQSRLRHVRPVGAKQPFDPANHTLSTNRLDHLQSHTRLQQPQPSSNNPIIDCSQQHVFAFPSNTNGCHVVNQYRPHCALQNLRIDPRKIHSGAQAGVPLGPSIMGQDEQDEYIQYEKGALVVDAELEGWLHDWLLHRAKEKGSKQDKLETVFYKLADALGSVQAVTSNSSSNNLTMTTAIDCNTTLHGTTLLVVRYEYVNLYHTLTDLWNAFWSAADDLQQPKEHVNVLLLDAHPQGNLDPIWEDLFGGIVSHIQRLPSTTCVPHARLVPVGYTSPLALGVAINTPTTREIALQCRPRYNVTSMSQFVHFCLERYNLTHVQAIPNRIVVLDRVPYVAHPRSDASSTVRALSNLASHVEKTLSHHKKVTGGASYNHSSDWDVQIHTLVNLTMREQIQTIREASIVIGNHGAGLTHLVWMQDDTHVIELSCDHNFFVQLQHWKPGVHHHCQPQVVNGIISDKYWNEYVMTVVEEIMTNK